LCQPIGARQAYEMGFLDDAFGNDAKTFEVELRQRAVRLAQDPGFRGILRKKHESRLDDECFKPLASYRAEELDCMTINLFGPNRAYHEARRCFVFEGKTPAQESRPSLPGKLGGHYKFLIRSGQGLPDRGVSLNLRHYPDGAQIAARQVPPADLRRGAGGGRFPANCNVLPPPAARVRATVLAGVQSSNAVGIVFLRCGRPSPAAIRGRCRSCCRQCPRRGCYGCLHRLWRDGDGRATIRASPCGSPAHETGRRVADPKR
jgi:hypothetical protein